MIIRSYSAIFSSFVNSHCIAAGDIEIIAPAITHDNAIAEKLIENHATPGFPPSRE
jgi:hypothetical protein